MEAIQKSREWARAAGKTARLTFGLSTKSDVRLPILVSALARVLRITDLPPPVWPTTITVCLVISTCNQTWPWMRDAHPARSACFKTSQLMILIAQGGWPHLIQLHNLVNLLTWPCKHLIAMFCKVSLNHIVELRVPDAWAVHACREDREHPGQAALPQNNKTVLRTGPGSTHLGIDR